MNEGMDPDTINKKEIMEHWGFHGFIGNFRYYFRLVSRVVFDSIARNTPLPGMAVFFHRKKGVDIGRQVYIGNRVVIDLMYPELITIEDNVSIGMNSMIFAHANPTNSVELKQKYYPRTTNRVVIKKGSWIAPGVIIMPGITIHENAVVGAGSVVVKDVPAYTVVIGNPAKPIRKLSEQ